MSIEESIISDTGQEPAIYKSDTYGKVIKSLQRRLTMILHKQGQPSQTQNESKWRIPSISNHTHMDNLTLLNSNKCIGHSNKERIQLNFVIGVLVHNLIATE